MSGDEMQPDQPRREILPVADRPYADLEPAAGEDDHNHLLDPEDVLRLAMAKQ